jgi:4-amino-4-deoxy-L-arabinose transferase-like glycosyltransferase
MPEALPPPHDRRLPTRREWAEILVAAAAAAVLRVAAADMRGFWQDEYYTLQAARLPLPELIRERLVAGHSPLPFLYAKLFLLFGDGETALRASSALACGVTVVAIALLALELRLGHALLPVLVLAVFQPYWVWIGTMFRYMMPLVALGTLWAWLTARHARAPTWRAGLAATLVGGLTLWFHSSTQFALLALVPFAAVCASRGRRLAALAPLAGALVLSLPIVWAVAHWRVDPEEIEPGEFELGSVLEIELATFFGDKELYQDLTTIPEEVFLGLFALFTVAAGVAAVRHGRRERDATAGVFLAAVLVAIPLGIAIYARLAEDIHERTRYQAYASVPLTLLFALAWREARRLGPWRSLPRALFAALVGVGCLAHVLNRGDYHRESVEWLAEVRRPQDPVLVIGSWHEIAFAYLGFPSMEGITFMSKYVDDEEIEAAVRRVFTDGDVGFIFLSTHLGTVRRLTSGLVREGLFVTRRIWRGGAGEIVGVARTREGARWLAILPALTPPWIAGKTH